MINTSGDVALWECCGLSVSVGSSSESDVHQWKHAVTDLSQSIKVINTPRPIPPPFFLTEQTENISNLNRTHLLKLHSSPSEAWLLDLQQCLLFECHQVSREGKKRIFAFSHCYCHDNCFKCLVCDWCFTASFYLASCHVREVQSFLHIVYSCERCAAEHSGMWYMQSIFSSSVISWVIVQLFILLLSNLPASPCLFPAFCDCLHSPPFPLCDWGIYLPQCYTTSLLLYSLMEGVTEKQSPHSC